MSPAKRKPIAEVVLSLDANPESEGAYIVQLTRQQSTLSQALLSGWMCEPVKEMIVV